MTSSKLYSLTQDTKEYLKTLDKDIAIYVIASEGSVDSTVSETLKRYQDGSDHITVEYKDPVKSPTFYQQFTDSSVSSGSLIVVCGEQSRVIDYSDLFESDIDYTTYTSTVTGYDGEGQITSALQYVTSDSMPKIYQVQGHGETTLSGNFSKTIEKANLGTQGPSIDFSYELQILRSSDLYIIPLAQDIGERNFFFAYHGRIVRKMRRKASLIGIFKNLRRECLRGLCSEESLAVRSRLPTLNELPFHIRLHQRLQRVRHRSDRNHTLPLLRL